jgi:hypothetical protein
VGKWCKREEVGMRVEEGRVGHGCGGRKRWAWWWRREEVGMKVMEGRGGQGGGIR